MGTIRYPVPSHSNIQPLGVSQLVEAAIIVEETLIPTVILPVLSHANIQPLGVSRLVGVTAAAEKMIFRSRFALVHEVKTGTVKLPTVF